MTSSNADAERHTLEHLKRRAKALKKAEGLIHHEALERVAQEIGFASFWQAQKKLQDSNSTSAPSQPDVEEAKEEKSTKTQKSNKPLPYEEFQRKSRRDFGLALGDFPDGTSGPLEDLNEITHYLNRVLSSASTCCFMPEMGNVRFNGAVRSGFDSIRLKTENSGMRCMPSFLEIHYIQESPGDSVLMLHVDNIEPATHYSEDGSSSFGRHGKGKLLFSAVGGIWGQMRRADGGLHSRYSIDEVGEAIRMVIEKYGVPV